MPDSTYSDELQPTSGRSSDRLTRTAVRRFMSKCQCSEQGLERVDAFDAIQVIVDRLLKERHNSLTK